MLFVQGWILISAADVEKVKIAAVKMMTESQKETGCQDYNFSMDIAETNLFRITERWTSENDLNAHFATSHMAEFNAMISEITIEAMDVRLYSGDEVRILMQS